MKIIKSKISKDVIKDVIKDTTKDVTKDVIKESVCISKYEDYQKRGLVFPTGLHEFDWRITGIGGFPGKRISCVAGAWSAGKTSLALAAAKKCLDRGGIAIFVDAEAVIDDFTIEYIDGFGFIKDSLKIVSDEDISVTGKKVSFSIEQSIMYVLKPYCIEEAFDKCELLIKTIREIYADIPIIMVYDSMVGLPARQECTKDYIDTTQRALVAAAYSTCFRRYTAFGAKYNVCSIFTNQLRDDPSGFSMGDTQYMPGGKAIEFYCSLLVRLNKVMDDKKGKILEADSRIKTSIMLKKTKIKPVPIGTKIFCFYTVGKGFDFVMDLITYLIKIEKIIVRGGWFTIEGKEQNIQGYDNLVKYCIEEDNYNELQQIVVKHIEEYN